MVQELFGPESLLMLDMRTVERWPRLALAAVARHLVIPLHESWKTGALPKANQQNYAAKIAMADVPPGEVCELYVLLLAPCCAMGKNGLCVLDRHYAGDMHRRRHKFTKSRKMPRHL